MGIVERDDFSIGVVVIFVLVMIRHGMNILTQFIKMLTPETMEYNGQTIVVANHAFASYSIALSVIIIASLILVLCKKIIGAYIFLAVQIVNCAILLFMHTDDGVAHIFVTLLMCAIFADVLCIRKEGKSGWDVLRNNHSMED